MRCTWGVGSLLALVSSACILPVSTGTPLPATTVGQGHLGVSMSGEAPVLDLLADGDNYSELRGAAPAAAMTFSVAYGLGEDTDIEVAGEGALYYFILPLPTGGSIGLRHHLGSSDTFDFAIAGKVGGVTSGASSTDANGTTESSASATYTAVQAVMQRKRGWVRPLAAINLMPFRIRRHPSDEAEYRFVGLASSVTLGLMVTGDHLQVGPYFTFTSFASDRFDTGFFPSFGLMLAVRPDRNRPRPVMQVPQTPYYGPPPPAPYPSPYPSPPPAAPPAPYPGPAPSPAPAGPPGSGTPTPPPDPSLPPS